MLAFTLKRSLIALLVAFTVSIVTFMLLRLSGDAAVAIAGEGASASDIEYVRVQYGLDRPLLVHYWSWLTRALSGDFGYSYSLRADVATVIFERLPVTLTLGVLALTFALVLAIPLGVLAATRPNTLIDRVALTISVTGQAMPSFWFALLLVVLFGIKWRLLPVSGNATWQHFILPAIALGYYATPAIMRLTRTGMLEVLQADYVRTARAKGLLPHVVLFKHALRNAIIPVVSLSAVQLGFMLGGSIVIETVFSLNGLGHLAWQSIQRADLTMMQAIVLIFACIYIFLTWLADLLNAWLDPRISVT